MKIFISGIHRTDYSCDAHPQIRRSQHLYLVAMQEQLLH